MNTNSRNVTYSTVGDYQLPNLTLNQPRKPLGKYGRLRRTYLKDHRPVLYNTMLLNGSLYPHLMEVEQTAESQMQQTMKQYITAMRINHVRALLSDTDKTILDIALTAGFRSSSRFYSTFTRYVGMPPQQYRKLSQQRRHGLALPKA